jgi:hypothetical protein
MRIHVGRAALVPELLRYFEEQADCVVIQVGENEIEVSLLGSYRVDRHDLAVERLLARFWTGPGKQRLEPPATNGNGNGHGNGNGNGKGTAAKPDADA